MKLDEARRDEAVISKLDLERRDEMDSLRNSLKRFEIEIEDYKEKERTFAVKLLLSLKKPFPLHFIVTVDKLVCKQILPNNLTLEKVV